MANILDRFQKSVVGSKTRYSDFIDVISPSGDFTRITDINVILKSWFKILITPTRTVDHDPEFGCDLYKYVFSPADNETMRDIIDEVTYAIRTYDNRAKLQGVTVEFLNNRKGFSINIIAEYGGQTGEIQAVIDKTTFNILGN